MSRRVQVDFNRVSTQTAQHRAAINQAMSNLDREYTQLLSGLRNMDGATNAAFMTSTQRNREKAIATAQILERTLTFINNSSMQIQAQDQAIAARFGNRRMGGQ